MQDVDRGHRRTYQAFSRRGRTGERASYHSGCRYLFAYLDRIVCQSLPDTYKAKPAPAGEPKPAPAGGEAEPHASCVAAPEGERAPAGEEEPNVSYVAAHEAERARAGEEEPDVSNYEAMFDEASSDEAVPAEPVPDEDMLDAEAETSPAPRT